MSEFDTECGHRLTVLVVQRTSRFEIVELWCAPPSHAGDAVAEFGRHAFRWSNHERSHAVVSVVGVMPFVRSGLFVGSYAAQDPALVTTGKVTRTGGMSLKQTKEFCRKSM